MAILSPNHSRFFFSCRMRIWALFAPHTKQIFGFLVTSRVTPGHSPFHGNFIFLSALLGLSHSFKKNPFFHEYLAKKTPFELMCYQSSGEIMCFSFPVHCQSRDCCLSLGWGWENSRFFCWMNPNFHSSGWKSQWFVGWGIFLLVYCWKIQIKNQISQDIREEKKFLLSLIVIMTGVLIYSETIKTGKFQTFNNNTNNNDRGFDLFRNYKNWEIPNF